MRSKFFVFFIICALMVLIISAQNQNQEIKAEDLKWESTAFGQSVDLNFSSTIAANKIGINGAIPEFPGTIKGKIIIESRGGKIAKAHDGIAFYYTVIDPSKYNFMLEADVLIEEFGPGTGDAPNTQTSCGLMVRDVNGVPRKDPMVAGYEELPAASNIAAVGVFSKDKVKFSVNAILRNGILYPWGNSGGNLTLDPFVKDIPGSKSFKMKLERTNNGFIMTYSDIDGKNSISKEMTGTADIVQVIDKNKMYVGFFSARNAKMTVTNAKLFLSPAKTVKGAPYAQTQINQFFEIESSDGTAGENYILSARAAYSGSVSVKMDDKIVVEKDGLKAGVFYKYNAKIINKTAKFDLVFTPSEGPESKPVEKTIIVERRDFKNTEFIVSLKGKPDAAGTADDPLDLATAVKFTPHGGTLFLREGDYRDFKLLRNYSGIEGKLKKMMPYKNETVLFEGLHIEASYWHFYKIDATKGLDYGFWIQGNGSIFELCTARGNYGTGFNISSKIKTDSMKTGNNLFLNCTSYDNADATMENADGFAVKSLSGTGNVFRGCIARNNADDGWDLFNNMQDGPIGIVVMENCIAYRNGFLSDGRSAAGLIGSGFKLGGEGQPVGHITKNCIAYENKMDGFTCNFNPGPQQIMNSTAFDNGRFNYIFRSNPYMKPQGTFINNISYRSEKSANKNKDFIEGIILENNIFYAGTNDKIKESDFVTIKAPKEYKRDKAGSIIWGDFLRPSKNSFLNKAGKGGTNMGALSDIK